MKINILSAATSPSFRKSQSDCPESRKKSLTGYPFDFAQGGESFDFAQDREPVERPVEPRISPAVGGLVRYDVWGLLKAFSAACQLPIVSFALESVND